jgi:DNA mismatch repair protein MutS
MIDKSSTAIGRRLLKERLLNPIMEKDELDEFLRDISKSIDLDTSRRITNNTVDENFLMSGVDETIDTLVRENATILVVFEDTMTKIEVILKSVNTGSSNKLVTLGLLEKDGYLYL